MRRGDVCAGCQRGRPSVVLLTRSPPLPLQSSCLRALRQAVGGSVPTPSAPARPRITPASTSAPNSPSSFSTRSSTIVWSRRRYGDTGHRLFQRMRLVARRRRFNQLRQHLSLRTLRLNHESECNFYLTQLVFDGIRAGSRKRSHRGLISLPTVPDRGASPQASSSTIGAMVCDESFTSSRIWAIPSATL